MAENLKEVENLRMLWRLAVWFIAITWPVLTALITYFYLKSEKFKDRHIQELESTNKQFLEIIKDKLFGKK